MSSKVTVEQCDGGFKIVIPEATEEQTAKFSKYLNHVYKHKHVATGRAADIAKTLE